jgi:hypothetical protein
MKMQEGASQVGGRRTQKKIPSMVNVTSGVSDFNLSELTQELSSVDYPSPLAQNRVSPMQQSPKLAQLTTKGPVVPPVVLPVAYVSLDVEDQEGEQRSERRRAPSRMSDAIDRAVTPRAGGDARIVREYVLGGVQHTLKPSGSQPPTPRMSGLGSTGAASFINLPAEDASFHVPPRSCAGRMCDMLTHLIVTGLGGVVGGQFGLLSANSFTMWSNWWMYYFLSSDVPNWLGTMTAVLSVGTLFSVNVFDAMKENAFDRSSKILFGVSVYMALVAIITSIALAFDATEKLNVSNNIRWMLAVAWAVGYTGSTRLTGAYNLLGNKYREWGLMERFEPKKYLLCLFADDLAKHPDEIPHNLADITPEFIAEFWTQHSGDLMAMHKIACGQLLKNLMTKTLLGDTALLLFMGADLGRRGILRLCGRDQDPDNALLLATLHFFAIQAGLVMTIFYANMTTVIVDRLAKVSSHFWRNVVATLCHEDSGVCRKVAAAFVATLWVALIEYGVLGAIAFGSAKGLTNEAITFGNSTSPYNVFRAEWSAGLHKESWQILAMLANYNFMLGFHSGIQDKKIKYDVSTLKAVFEELFGCFALENKRKLALNAVESRQEKTLADLRRGKSGISETCDAASIRAMITQRRALAKGCGVVAQNETASLPVLSIQDEGTSLLPRHA